MVVRTEKINVLTLEDFHRPNMGFMMAPLENMNHEFADLLVPNQRMFYSIFYFEQGRGLFAVDQSMFQVGSGEVITINPNSVCTFELEKDAKGWLLLFNDSFFSKRYNDNVLHDFTFIQHNMFHQVAVPVTDVSKLQMMMSSMAEEYAQEGSESKSILRSYLNIVLGMLDRQGGPVHDSHFHREKEYKVRKFEQLLEQYFKSERFPSFYAEKLNISTNYLNRICKERRNTSVGTLIRERILMESERLLLHTFKTISEISFDLGFDSASYFITFFKKKYGKSPEEFRKDQLLN